MPGSARARRAGRGVRDALGTLVANVAGSCLLGYVAARSPRFIGTGFCGALTTFSTFQVELLELQPGWAVAYAVASISAGYAALVLGRRMTWAAMMLAGGAGAVARYLVSLAVTRPFGTLIVNLTGAFALGALSENFVLGTGFVGAYTTFSTWMLETDDLVRDGRRGAALANILGSLALGLAAARLGIEVGSRG